MDKWRRGESLGSAKEQMRHGKKHSSIILHVSCFFLWTVETVGFYPEGPCAVYSPTDRCINMNLTRQNQNKGQRSAPKSPVFLEFLHHIFGLLRRACRDQSWQNSVVHGRFGWINWEWWFDGVLMDQWRIVSNFITFWFYPFAQEVDSQESFGWHENLNPYLYIHGDSKAKTLARSVILVETTQSSVGK